MLKISIVTVCFNAIDNIEGTIYSVLHQNYSNIEYIVIDGGSTDNTTKVIEKYVDRINKYISEPDKGIYDAMNKGASLAAGKYILFMNAGDKFVDDQVLTKVFEKAKTDSDVIYGDNILVYSNNEVYHKAHFFSKKDINLPFNHQSAFVRSDLMRQFPFNLKYKIAGDYNFFYNLHKQGRTFQYLPIPIAKYAMDGISQAYVIKTYKEICEIRNQKRDMVYFFTLLVLKIKGIAAQTLPYGIIKCYRQFKNR